MNITSPMTDPRIAAGAHSILRACESYVPANANIDEAIVAHRMALGRFVGTRDEADQRLAAFVIRAVFFAATKTREQAQQKVDYLAALTIEAWEGLVSGGDAAEIREETLAGCARMIALMTD